MKYEIPFRLNVIDPPAGVVMQVQKSKYELLPPSKKRENRLVFDFEITVDLSDDAPNFLGKFAQGPKAERFVYVNSGKRAGQQHTACDRRAKLSLMGIARREIESLIASPGSRFEVTVNGTGRDGGAFCASIKGVEWKAVKR